MKFKTYSNRTEVTEIDLQDDDQCRDLGRLVATDCVVLVRQGVPEERLFEIQSLWGTPATVTVFQALGEKRLSGRHWRRIQLNLGYMSKGIDHISKFAGMSRVRFEKNSNGKSIGAFSKGKLAWHSDQQTTEDSQHVIGLMSLWGSEGSRTSFLSTAKAYEALSAMDKSIVDELITVCKWDGETVVSDPNDIQKETLKYSALPIDNMECSVVAETAAGVKGIKYPAVSFDRFRGMSRAESLKYRAHLWTLINKPEYIYHHNWQDGEIMFMDQCITLHARPTSVQEDNPRTMCRMNSYMEKLFPNHAPVDYVRHDGEKIDYETFFSLVDEARRREFYNENIKPQ